MGQALDRDGNVLGEVFGKTKREVFDELMKDHADAHEIRIHTVEQRLTDAEVDKYLTAAKEAPDDPDRVERIRQLFKEKIAQAERDT